jgi:TetR/AcrR family transcriptional regulator
MADALCSMLIARRPGDVEWRSKACFELTADVALPTDRSVKKSKSLQSKKPQRRDAERTKRKLLSAAAREFAAKGLEGARVDVIAARARVNKQLLYHYFKSKDGLFTATLERAYARIREREDSIDVNIQSPKEAMERLMGLFVDYFIEMPDEIAIIADENVHHARHVLKSEKIKKMGTKLVSLVETILTRGQEAGMFRKDVDAMRLIILMLGVGSIYASNHYTLSALYNRDLHSRAELKQWRAYVTDFVLGGLRP